MYSEATVPKFRELVPEQAVIERVSYGHLFTEGPVWNAREGALFWVDIAGNTIWRWEPGVGRSVFLSPSGKANGLTIDSSGRLVVAGWTSRTVWRMELDGSTTQLAWEHDGVPLGTPNDIVIKSDGSIYWTDGFDGTRLVGFETDADLQIHRPFAAMMCVNPDTGVVRLLSNEVRGCNGLAFSPNESLLYVNDSPRRILKVFDVLDDGSLANCRDLAQGVRSATKVDIEGNIYCTGEGVDVLDPSGAHLGRINIPDHTTNLAWGDEDWGTLYVTGGESVYRVRTTAHGIPVGVPPS